MDAAARSSSNVLAGYEDGVCTVWQTNGGATPSNHQQHELSGWDGDPVAAVKWAGGTAAVAGADGRLRFYNNGAL
jgi:hypothetical protein